MVRHSGGEGKELGKLCPVVFLFRHTHTTKRTEMLPLLTVWEKGSEIAHFESDVIIKSTQSTEYQRVFNEWSSRILNWERRENFLVLIYTPTNIHDHTNTVIQRSWTGTHTHTGKRV